MKLYHAMVGAALFWGTFLLSAGFGDPEIPRKVVLHPEKQMVLAENGKVNCEVVSPDDSAPAAKFAAKELAKYLSESVGAEVPVVKAPNAGKISLLVGTGANVSKLPRDGFIIRASDSRIVIAGRDDKRYTPGAKYAPWGDYWERATLFAVYDFLERFLGAKFVFPGDGGTVIPKHRVLKVPAMDILDRPDNPVRYISWYVGKWYDGDNADFNRKLNNYRLRMQTAYIPNCHGLGRMAYIERFAKSHPEYFALRPNGTRSCTLSEHMGGQLCFSSGIQEEIYQDAKAWLTGKSAKSRNMRNARYNAYVWDLNAVQPGYFNIMPQDGMTPCQCDACRKIAGEKNGASNQVWKLTCDVANRLKKEGIPGYLTQMAYGNHAAIPPFDIPDNVLVMVAVYGPWSGARPDGWKSQLATIRSWTEKLNKKVWLWTYPTKYAGTKIPNIPCSTPEAVGKFYSDVSDTTFGSFMESSSDYAAFQFFNWYVFSRKMWYKDTDTTKLLSETYRALYGAGAPEMEKFFRRLETLWLTRITGNVTMTSTGPGGVVPPTESELWNEIYSEKELASLDAMLRAAEKAAANDPGAKTRIAFIRKHYFDVLKKGRTTFFGTQQTLKSLRSSVAEVPAGSIRIDGKPDEAAWKKASVICLTGLNDAPAEVRTFVRCLRDAENLYVSWVCEEPEMADGVVPEFRKDDPDIWKSECVEFFLNPTGERSGYFQWMIARGGAFADLRKNMKNGVPASDFKWDSGAIVKTAQGADSWSVEMAIPLARLGTCNPENLAANFTRTRVRKSTSPMTYHTWSPFVKQYNDVENFGSLTFGEVPRKNLLEGGEFDVVRNGRFFGKWATGADCVLPKNDFVALDEKTSLFAGKSLRITNPGGKNINVSQYIREIRKGVKYRISFFVKVDMPEAGKGGVFIQFNDGSNFSVPVPAIRRSLPWTSYTKTFVARKSSEGKSLCYIRLYNYFCKATAWFDGVRVEEVSDTDGKGE